MVCDAIVLPRSLVVCAAAVARPVVPLVVVVVPPLEPEPVPLPEPAPEAVGGALTVLPPHAASRPATATATSGARNDDTLAQAASKVKKR
jgi:hypothetical protein